MGKCLKPGGKKWERRFWQGGIWEKKNYYVITRDEIQGMGGRISEKKYKHHKWHPKMIPDTEFYLNRTIAKCMKPGRRGEGGGREVKSGGEGWNLARDRRNAIPK